MDKFKLIKTKHVIKFNQKIIPKKDRISSLKMTNSEYTRLKGTMATDISLGKDIPFDITDGYIKRFQTCSQMYENIAEDLLKKGKSWYVIARPVPDKNHIEVFDPNEMIIYF